MRPNLPGFDRDDVFLLRTKEDADAILAASAGERVKVVVVGNGFIGLEVARRCGSATSTSRSSRRATCR